MLEIRGHTVMMTACLDDALAVFSQQPHAFDVLFIDVIPPENDMLWVPAVRQMRSDILLLFTSAFLGEGFIRPDCGIYLPKPFTTDELSEAIDELTHQSAPTAVQLRAA